LLRLKRREARPSIPTIGLLSLTCMAAAVFSGVTFSKPEAKNV
jgi:hypothetical protein